MLILYTDYLHHSLQIYMHRICTSCSKCCSCSNLSSVYLNVDIATVLLAIPFMPHTSYLFILSTIRTYSALDCIICTPG